MKTDPKKFFKLTTRETIDGSNKKEYVCSVPNCPKGRKGKGLLERGNREVSHLRQHLTAHVNEGDMDVSDVGVLSIIKEQDKNNVQEINNVRYF